MKNIDNFNSLQYVQKIGEKVAGTSEYKYTAYQLSKECIKSKPAFSLEVLLCSEADETTDFANWQIPPYIREGLEWLRED